MISGEMQTKQYMCLLVIILFLCGQLIFCLHVLDKNNSKQRDVEDLKMSVMNFIKESTYTSYVDMDAGQRNQSKIVAEFTAQYTSLLIEMMASEKFDFIVQYEITPYSYKYEYVCKQTADCFKHNHPLSPYKTMRFIVQTTPETFNVHGKYYLK